MLILCEQKKAVTPYRFKVTDTLIESSEELCYYIYHNFLLLTEELLEEPFLRWLEGGLRIEEKAEKIRRIKGDTAGYEALLLAASILLHNSNYYSKEEVEEFLTNQKDRVHLSPAEIVQKKANSFLENGQYAEAGMLYEMLLSEHGSSLVEEEKGRIHHNLGVCRVHLMGFVAAAKEFKKAYELNKNAESMRQYGLCLLLMEDTQKVSGENQSNLLGEEDREKISQELEESLSSFQESKIYKKLSELEESRKKGDLAEFTTGVKAILAGFKQEYRRENQ